MNGASSTSIRTFGRAPPMEVPRTSATISSSLRGRPSSNASAAAWSSSRVAVVPRGM